MIALADQANDGTTSAARTSNGRNSRSHAPNFRQAMASGAVGRSTSGLWYQNTRDNLARSADYVCNLTLLSATVETPKERSGGRYSSLLWNAANGRCVGPVDEGEPVTAPSSQRTQKAANIPKPTKKAKRKKERTMTQTKTEKLMRPMELTDTELDAVAGGAPVIDQNMAGIAVGVVVQDVNVNVLTGDVNNA